MVYLLFDSHYYLAGHSFKRPFSNEDVCYTQGMNFSAIPGPIPLLFGEGEITQLGDKMYMHVSGQSEPYYHDRVFFPNAMTELVCPFNTYFIDERCADDWMVNKMLPIYGSFTNCLPTKVIK